MENMGIEEFDNTEIKTIGDLIIARHKDGLCGLFTKSGEALTPICFKEIWILFVVDEERSCYDSTVFKPSIISVLKDNLWGAFNVKGQELLPCVYEEIDYDIGIVKAKKDGMWGWINEAGEILLKLQCV